MTRGAWRVVRACAEFGVFFILVCGPSATTFPVSMAGELLFGAGMKGPILNLQCMSWFRVCQAKVCLQHETRTNLELEQAGKRAFLTKALGIETDGMASCT